MTAMEALRKNAHFLISGFVSAIVVLGLMRWSSGAPLFQPQSDFGLLLGAVLVTGFVVFKDMRSSNGKHTS
ncbi:hypothetical protein [Rhodoblastus sp.]|uniref:hypothetical protein n=1 Tax=Rhodoblastus sp. TaxID=1962975 RepID=UPI0035B1C6AD